MGLHTVFEHHEAMTPAALTAFLHEYRLTFPAGVDFAATNGPLPQTMAAYALQGPPTPILIDRCGRRPKQNFEAEDDMRVGADIAYLLAEQEPTGDP